MNSSFFPYRVTEKERKEGLKKTLIQKQLEMNRIDPETDKRSILLHDKDPTSLWKPRKHC
jgi:hypothetical protein